MQPYFVEAVLVVDSRNIDRLITILAMLSNSSFGNLQSFLVESKPLRRPSNFFPLIVTEPLKIIASRSGTKFN